MHVPKRSLRAGIFPERFFSEWESLASDFYDQWQPGRQVVVYGEVDSDNGQEVASRLRDESAIENVWVLKGGYEAWRAR